MFARPYTINVWGTLWNWIYEAVFQIGEAGFKLFVTTWVPRFMQSVYASRRIGHCLYALHESPETVLWLQRNSAMETDKLDTLLETLLYFHHNLALFWLNSPFSYTDPGPFCPFPA